MGKGEKGAGGKRIEMMFSSGKSMDRISSRSFKSVRVGPKGNRNNVTRFIKLRLRI